MRILYVVRSTSDDVEKLVTMDFVEARNAFVKSKKYYGFAVYFEDIAKKGRFKIRFDLWKKIGKFGVDDGIMIHDCENKRKKDKLVCETVKEFPTDEFFLNKYIAPMCLELK